MRLYKGGSSFQSPKFDTLFTEILISCLQRRLQALQRPSEVARVHAAEGRVVGRNRVAWRLRQHCIELCQRACSGVHHTAGHQPGKPPLLCSSIANRLTLIAFLLAPSWCRAQGPSAM